MIREYALAPGNNHLRMAFFSQSLNFVIIYTSSLLIDAIAYDMVLYARKH